jgi:DNA-binding MarR family transcriptional regulator
MPQEYSKYWRDSRSTYRRILKFTGEYIDTHGYSPSIREIADAIGRKVSTTSYHLHGMCKSGLITWERHIPRTIRLTDKGREKAAS